ncbi:MAG: alpha/beta fold hydrolase [Winogradskyella sp.]
MILEYKNTSIYYNVTGKGEPVVLLHGFLETVAMWQTLIPKLSKNHQIICIDLLGHGNTDCLGYVHTMETMADAVRAVLNSLNIEKATFIGHSMGGYVALALAERHPKLFSGLCLMNSTFEADDDDRKTLRMRANKMATRNFENLVRMSFANLFAPESKTKFQTELNDALQLALKTPVQGYIAAQEGMRIRTDTFEVFNRLKCKKLIIIGEKDSVINGKKILHNIANTDIDYVQFSEGHMSHIENKTELQSTLLAFIAAR